MPFEIFYESPAQMVLPERLLLYSLIYGLRPAMVLEIGTAEGGSAMIICAAMDAAERGKLVCVDPAPKIIPEHWERIAHRATLLKGLSTDTEAIQRAAGSEDAQFDFVLVDGDHSYQGVLDDIAVVSRFVHNDSYILFHDAHYIEVREAIDAALQQYPLVDCGLLSLAMTQTDQLFRGHPVQWGGLRLVRFQPSHDKEVRLDQLPPLQPSELDLVLQRIRERSSQLSGWQGTVLRKTLKMAYRTLLGIGNRLGA